MDPFKEGYEHEQGRATARGHLRATLDPDGTLTTIGEGVSLRDRIAIEAMARIIAKFPPGTTDEPSPTENAMRIARGAYSYADAMLEVRDQ